MKLNKTSKKLLKRLILNQIREIDQPQCVKYLHEMKAYFEETSEELIFFILHVLRT